MHSYILVGICIAGYLPLSILFLVASLRINSYWRAYVRDRKLEGFGHFIAVISMFTLPLSILVFIISVADESLRKAERE